MTAHSDRLPPSDERTDLIARLADLTAGSDDRAAVLLFATISNLLDTFERQDPAEATAATRSFLLRPQGTRTTTVAGGRRRAIDLAVPPQRDSIFDDPVYLANARALMARRRSIINGVPTRDYPDCVAVGSDTDWCCSGTLVAPNVVLTAGHCPAGGCGRRVLFGPSISEPGARTVAVTAAVSHPAYQPGDGVNTSDLCVLILAEDVDIAPRALASTQMLASAQWVRLAGFGYTDTAGTGGYGVCRMVEVPLGGDPAPFGADPAIEFVAGAPFLDRDSCNGDSGGPAYVTAGGREYLVGTTSRATDRALRRCGDGGIYGLVPVFAEWIRAVPGGHW